MVKTFTGLSNNIDLSFKNAHDDINKLKLKSTILKDKINELGKINSELFFELNSIKKLVRDEKPYVQKSTPSRESIIAKIKNQHNTEEPKDTSTYVKKGKELAFYDVKARKRFTSTEYREVEKNKTLFAVAKSPNGNYECYRILKRLK